MTLITKPRRKKGMYEGINLTNKWDFELFKAIDVSDPEEFLAKIAGKMLMEPEHIENIWAGKVYQSDIDKLIANNHIREVEHLLSSGGRKWVDHTHNVITVAGENDLLDVYFDNGSTVNWYVGLLADGATPSDASTLATPGGFAEVENYSGVNRIQYQPAAASGGSIDNAGTPGGDPGPAQFSINGTVTISGGFLTAIQAKATDTGLLFSEALFQGGDRSVVNTDTLNVTITYSFA